MWANFCGYVQSFRTLFKVPLLLHRTHFVYKYQCLWRFSLGFPKGLECKFLHTFLVGLLMYRCQFSAKFPICFQFFLRYFNHRIQLEGGVAWFISLCVWVASLGMKFGSFRLTERKDPVTNHGPPWRAFCIFSDWWILQCRNHSLSPLVLRVLMVFKARLV